ncbi:MAG: hypothetical protein IJ131_06050 [Eggerthellaceae bacterium]|nr:hypothetical protein [Eggerthellaceae bacterium]
MTSQSVARVDQLRKAAQPTPRVSLTELARSTKWRESMVEYAVVELCDHSDTVGYLVSPVGLQDMLNRLEELEHELDEAQIAAIVAQRGGNAVWETGEQLASSVSDLFDAQAQQEATYANQ